MKELILFSIVALFIACQNPSHPKLETESKTSVSMQELIQNLTPTCQFSSKEPLDISKELANPIEPGFHYRPLALRSEQLEENFHSELVCSSGVTSSGDETSSSPLEAQNSSIEIPVEESTSWEVLTKKWEITKTVSTCQDHNLQISNPSCDESTFLSEEGKFNSANEDSIASL